MLLLLATAVIGAVVLFASRLSRRRKAYELGWMSEQWVAEWRTSRRR